MPAHRAPATVLLTASLAVAALVGPSPATAAAADPAPPPCTRYASPTGTDGAPGTQAAPVRSIARLIALLGPGGQGCLPAGARFEEPLGTFIVDAAGGAAGNPAVVRTDDPDGEPAQIHGAMWLKPGAHDLTFDRVRFSGSPGGNKSTMLVVHGDRITFRRTEMTWSRGICLNAGNREGYVAGDTAATVAAEDLVIERSRIHGCGTDPAVVASLRTAGQSGVHGLYLVNAPRAVIRDNLVYDNIARGIQLWPDVDDATIEHNVLDGNGSNLNLGSSAAYGHFSQRNLVRANVISNAVLRSVTDQPWGPGDTESIVGNFPQGMGTFGNALTGNCVFQADASKRFGGFGYEHSGDVFADPGYVDRATHDFTLRAGSPCAGMGPRTPVVPEPVPGPVAPPPAPAPIAGPEPAAAPASSPAPAPIAGPGAAPVPPGTAPVPPRDTVRPVLVVRSLRRTRVTIHLSERATVRVELQRRSAGRWTSAGLRRVTLAAGLRRVALPRGTGRGRTRVVLQAIDAAGNRSPRTVLGLR